MQLAPIRPTPTEGSSFEAYTTSRILFQSLGIHICRSSPSSVICIYHRYTRAPQSIYSQCRCPSLPICFQSLAAKTYMGLSLRNCTNRRIRAWFYVQKGSRSYVPHTRIIVFPLSSQESDTQKLLMLVENKVAVIDGTNIPAIMTVTGVPDASSSSFGASGRIYLSSPDGTDIALCVIADTE